MTWFYPSKGSNVINRSVTYNYLEDVWYTNTGFARTAWSDRGVYSNPFASRYYPNDLPTNLCPVFNSKIEFINVRKQKKNFF